MTETSVRPTPIAIAVCATTEVLPQTRSVIAAALPSLIQLRTSSLIRNPAYSNVLGISPTYRAYTMITWIARLVAKTRIQFRLVCGACVGCPPKPTCAFRIYIKRYQIFIVHGIAILDDECFSVF